MNYNYLEARNYSCFTIFALNNFELVCGKLFCMRLSTENTAAPHKPDLVKFRI
jgi:hypothetical protein